jgi:hypothetical protein
MLVISDMFQNLHLKGFIYFLEVVIYVT